MANFNLNKVIIAGRLTAEPELKQTSNGIPVCSFSVAVNRKANRQETDFISCIAWRQQAEFLCRFFHKGSSICVVGALQTRSWTDQSNQKRYSTDVIADEVNFVDSKSDSSQTTQPAKSSSSSAPSFSSPAFTSFEDVESDDGLPF